MRIAAIALAFFLTQFGQAFACEQLPAHFNINAATAEYSTLTGDYTLELTFHGLATSACTVSGRTLEIADAVTVRVSERSSSRVVQSYTTDITIMGSEMYLRKPRHMTGSSHIRLQVNTQGVMFMNVDGAAVPATVE